MGLKVVYITLPICFCSHLGFKPQIDCFFGLFICLLNPFSGLLYFVSWEAGLWKSNHLSFLAFCLLVGFREWAVPAGECKQEEKGGWGIFHFFNPVPWTRNSGSGYILLQPHLLCWALLDLWLQLLLSCKNTVPSIRDVLTASCS